MQALADAAKPGGLVVMSTINRTLRAFGAAIIGAEYVLRWLPWARIAGRSSSGRGAERNLERAGLDPLATSGMVPDLMARGFRLSRDTVVNYIVAARSALGGFGRLGSRNAIRPIAGSQAQSLEHGLDSDPVGERAQARAASPPIQRPAVEQPAHQPDPVAASGRSRRSGSERTRSPAPG